MYIVHLFPISVISPVKHLGHFWSPAIIGVLVIFIVIARRLMPSLLNYAYRFYIGVVILWSFIVAYFVFMIDPLETIGAFIAGGICYLIFKKGPDSLFPGFGILVLIILDAYRVDHAGLFFFYGFFGIITLASLNIVRPFKVAAALSMAIVMSLLLIRFGVFYQNNPVDLTSQVLKQSGVTKVFTYEDRSKISDDIGYSVRFFQSDCNASHYLLGTYSDGTLEIDSSTFKYRRIGHHTTSENVALDCSTNRTFIGDNLTGALWIRYENSDKADYQPTLKLAVTQVHFHNNKLYVSDEWNRNIYVFDSYSFKLLQILEHTGNRDMEFDDQTNRLFTTTFWRLNAVDLISGRIIDQAWFPSIHLKLAADPLSHSIFLSSFSTGTLYKVDMKTLKTDAKLKLARGIRFVFFDPVRRIVYVAGYIDGYIYAVNPEKMSLIGKLYVGHRVRGIGATPDGSILLAGSCLGAFLVDTKQAFR